MPYFTNPLVGSQSEHTKQGINKIKELEPGKRSMRINKILYSFLLVSFKMDFIEVYFTL